ncbi:MAG TPA: type IX secretion system membrane protein PorP/SprF [Pelobium sp.]|nr:type IX secretion system membrane protein PorP/SprF [Pelobium sp.]
MKRYIITIICLTTLGTLLGTGVKAQLSPMKSQYFQNPYLVNPAMAGYSGKTSIFANYANQWNKIDGSPVMMSLSLSAPITENAALGINYISDQAGLVNRSQAMGTFAYKVKLAEEHNVRFGVSLSWSQDRLDQAAATSNGDNDPALNKYNERQSYLDGNFGVAYIGKRLEAQFSYLNLNQKRQNQFSTVDYSTFYSAISYKIDLEPSHVISVKPLLAYRGVKGYDNQWDVAAEWSADQLKFYTMYHSNKSFSGGIGFTYLQKLVISCLYSTEPQGLQGMTGGQFDVVLGYQF